MKVPIASTIALLAFVLGCYISSSRRGLPSSQEMDAAHLIPQGEVTSRTTGSVSIIDVTTGTIQKVPGMSNLSSSAIQTAVEVKSQPQHNRHSYSSPGKQDEPCGAACKAKKFAANATRVVGQGIEGLAKNTVDGLETIGKETSNLTSNAVTTAANLTSKSVDAVSKVAGNASKVVTTAVDDVVDFVDDHVVSKLIMSVEEAENKMMQVQLIADSVRSLDMVGHATAGAAKDAIEFLGDNMIKLGQKVSSSVTEKFESLFNSDNETDSFFNSKFLNELTTFEVQKASQVASAHALLNGPDSRRFKVLQFLDKDSNPVVITDPLENPADDDRWDSINVQTGESNCMELQTCNQSVKTKAEVKKIIPRTSTDPTFIPSKNATGHLGDKTPTYRFDNGTSEGDASFCGRGYYLQVPIPPKSSLEPIRYADAVRYNLCQGDVTLCVAKRQDVGFQTFIPDVNFKAPNNSSYVFKEDVCGWGYYAPPEPDCTDMDQECPTWAADGRCETDEVYMSVTCCRSCELKSRGCDDLDERCEEWASPGPESDQSQCQKDPDKMMKVCVGSCKACGTLRQWKADLKTLIREAHVKDVIKGAVKAELLNIIGYSQFKEAQAAFREGPIHKNLKRKILAILRFAPVVMNALDVIGFAGAGSMGFKIVWALIPLICSIADMKKPAVGGFTGAGIIIMQVLDQTLEKVVGAPIVLTDLKDVVEVGIELNRDLKAAASMSLINTTSANGSPKAPDFVKGSQVIFLGAKDVREMLGINVAAHGEVIAGPDGHDAYTVKWQGQEKPKIVNIKHLQSVEEYRMGVQSRLQWGQDRCLSGSAVKEAFKNALRRVSGN